MQQGRKWIKLGHLSPDFCIGSPNDEAIATHEVAFLIASRVNLKSLKSMQQGRIMAQKFNR